MWISCVAFVIGILVGGLGVAWWIGRGIAPYEAKIYLNGLIQRDVQ